MSSKKDRIYRATKERAAKGGIDTPPEVTMRLEDLQAGGARDSNDSDFQSVLALHRKRLRLRCEQQAKLGLLTPPYIQFDIDDARKAIQVFKAQMRAQGFAVEDLPDDEPNEVPGDEP